jgi:hypothetical protein
MRDRVLLFVLAMSLSVGAQAQVILQTAPAPLVTVENATAPTRGEPIYWNGDIYYPTRPAQLFNPLQMVRTGSLNGIPLYIDPMHEPGSIVFVLLSSGLVQPYGPVPTPAPVYDPLPAPAPVDIASLRGMSEPMAVGTTGRIAAAPLPPLSSLNPPTGVNGIWVNYDGRRWFLAGKAIDYDAGTLAEVGVYHGWTVYTRNGDPTTIYIPTTPGRLAPYRSR